MRAELVTLLPRAESVAQIASEMGARLSVSAILSLPPRAFWPQRVRRSVGAVWLFPMSSPLCVSHRLTGTRTQMRHTIEAGACLIRSPSVRESWAVAITPLAGAADLTMRRVVLLTLQESSSTIEPKIGDDLCAFSLWTPTAS